MVTNVTSRSVTLRWQPPLKDRQNGIIRSYTVLLQRVDGVVVTNTTYTTEALEMTVVVLPFRSYTISVAAVTVEEGVRSDAISVSTPEDGKCMASAHLY